MCFSSIVFVIFFILMNVETNVTASYIINLFPWMMSFHRRSIFQIICTLDMYHPTISKLQIHGKLMV